MTHPPPDPPPSLPSLLAEWDWVTFGWGQRLHHAAHLCDPLDDWGESMGRTSCGFNGLLQVPSLGSRLAALRCVRCCRAVGYPRGTGSPKNDDACRDLVEDRLRAQGVSVHEGA